MILNRIIYCGVNAASVACSKTGVPNLSLTMYHFSILRDEHVPLQHFRK